MPKSFSKTFFILSLVLFVFPNTFLFAESQKIIISEIAWMGTENSSNDEWLELKNLTNQEINLEGWSLTAQDGSPKINLSGKIAPGGYFLLERTDDTSVPNVQADLIYAGALSNGGESLKLRDENSNLIDSVDANDAWPAGDNNNKRTMERKHDLSWQTSENAGGTPKSTNTSPQEPSPSEDGDNEGGYCGDGDIDEDEECDDGNLNNNDGCDDNCKIEVDDGSEEEDESTEDEAEKGILEKNIKDNNYKSGDVVINEFCSDPTDEDVEWVELFNNLYDEDVSLDGWYIEDGEGNKTYLKGEIKRSGAKKYFVIENIKGHLDNQGDAIKLVDSDGKLIDQVYYGNWEGRISNAPVADDPNSVARKWDGQNTYNDKNDFLITSTPTKGAPNIATLKEDQQEISPEEREKYDYSNKIIISEIFPNPSGDDEEKEFIEIFNQDDRSVNLEAWKLSDNSSRKYEFKENLFIKSGQYLVVKRKESEIVLNNLSDKVELFRPFEDKPFQTVEYKDAIENQSYSFDGKNWKWTEKNSPGSENRFEVINHPPVVDFYFPENILVNTPVFFDASDTFDIDKDNLSFLWNFGDGVSLNLKNPTHGYINPGNYTIKLKVSDGKNEVSKEKGISVLSGEDNFNPEFNRSTKEQKQSLIINEILPDPEGSDTEGEFIEFKNLGTTKVNLLNWKVDDIEGGSKPYEFIFDTWIEPDDFYVLERIESGLALNNSNEQVRLFNNFDDLIEKVEYEKAIQGESFSRGQDGEFYWTSRITPGEENVISVSDSMAYVAPQVAGVKIENKKTENSKEYQKINLAEINNYESGDLIITQGSVIVEPGILGSQYFYITDSPTSTSSTQVGVQIYNYYKKFPKLEIGNYIEITGELSETNGEKRLKTKTEDDVVVLKTNKDIKIQTLKCDQISDEYLGQLISITGEVVEQKSSTVYLDDGTEEIRVYVKSGTGISPKIFKEGDDVSVTGILGKTTSGLRLLPRSLDDVIKKDIESSDNYFEVLGEKIESNKWELAQRDKKLELFKYLLVIAGGVILFLSGLLIKEFRK